MEFLRIEPTDTLRWNAIKMTLSRSIKNKCKQKEN